MLGTLYQFAHHRTVDGERCLVWGNGIGELLVPVASPEYIEALNDRDWDAQRPRRRGRGRTARHLLPHQAKRTTLYGRLYGAGIPRDGHAWPSPRAPKSRAPATAARRVVDGR